MAMAMAMAMAMQIGVCSALYKIPLTHFGPDVASGSVTIDNLQTKQLI